MFNLQPQQLSLLCEPWYVHLFLLRHIYLTSPQQFERLNPVRAAAYDSARPAIMLQRHSRPTSM